MGKKIKSWESDGWFRGEKLIGGRQGHTFFARRNESETGVFDCVLKTLMHQDDANSRRRFHIEVESLRTLDLEPGVSKLRGTNAGSYADADVDLYIVTERIFGADLTRYTGNPIDVSSACAILQKTLTTLSRCHELGIAHRDLKPCHVILRNEELSDPVLIDFGLAVNEEIVTQQGLTASDHGIGNRFIILPEQLDGRGKQDKRSDITQCVGLFYFLITGHRPGIIVGEKRRKPHERNQLEISPTLTPTQQKQLRRIFDVGFEWDIDRRWSTAASLSKQLEILANGEESVSDMDFESGLEFLAQRVKEDPEHESVVKTKELCELMTNRSATCAGMAVQRFRDQISIMNGPHDGQPGVNYAASWVISQNLANNKSFNLVFEARRDLDRLILRGHLKKNPGHGFFAPGFTFGGDPQQAKPPVESLEILQFDSETPLFSPEATQTINAFVNDLWMKSVEKVFYPA